jgi:hypothetical protein
MNNTTKHVIPTGAREERARGAEETAPECRAVQSSKCRTQQISRLRFAPLEMTTQWRVENGEWRMMLARQPTYDLRLTTYDL